MPDQIQPPEDNRSEVEKGGELATLLIDYALGIMRQGGKRVVTGKNEAGYDIVEYVDLAAADVKAFLELVKRLKIEAPNHMTPKKADQDLEEKAATRMRLTSDPGPARPPRDGWEAESA